MRGTEAAGEIVREIGDRQTHIHKDTNLQLKLGILLEPRSGRKADAKAGTEFESLDYHVDWFHWI